MEILDRFFMKLPLKKKIFLIIIGMAFFSIALASYLMQITTLIESLLIFLVGMIYGDLIKLTYRIENMEKKWKK
jgi:uncharacterized membrane protein YqgA involved in biofilm formation